MQTDDKLYDMNPNVEAATNRVEEAMAKGKEGLSELGQTLVDTTKDYARVTDRYVHDNSWKAIGMAAAFGLIIGMLLHRR